MSHQVPDFETKDVLGKTLPYNSTVGTSAISLPNPAQTKISEVMIRNPKTNLVTTNLYYSFDAGSTFMTLGRGEFLVWTLKTDNSGTPITQIKIKGSLATTYYEVIINVEPN